MIYRGCIVKIEEKFAIVMTDTMEYIKIVKKDQMAIGKQILFVKEDMYKEKQLKFNNMRMIAAAILLMIFSVTLFGKVNIFSFASNAAAVVSIDINPSIEFEIDKLNEVMKAVPVNDDGEKLMNRDFKGMPIDEALFVVIKNAKQKHYLTKKKNAIIISTAVVKENFKVDVEKFEKEIEEKIKNDAELKQVNLIYIQSNKEDFKEARKQKVSIGKYEVYKKAKEVQKEEFTLEQIKNMKVQEIVDRGIGKLKVKSSKNEIEKKEKNNPSNKEEHEKEDIKLNNQKKKEELKEDKKEKIEQLKKEHEEKKEERKEALKEKKEEKIEQLANKHEEKKEEIEADKAERKEELKEKKEEKIEQLKKEHEEKREEIEVDKEERKEELKEKEKIEQMKNKHEEKKEEIEMGKQERKEELEEKKEEKIDIHKKGKKKSNLVPKKI